MIHKSSHIDLGGLDVRRVLPRFKSDAIGPIVFFDHMGASDALPSPINIRPHPHIGLATLTYLYQGTIAHADSLGNCVALKPHAINLMISGSGIVHSERSPELDSNQRDQAIHGLQFWLAQPIEMHLQSPKFFHIEKQNIPSLVTPDYTATLIMGEYVGTTSVQQFNGAFIMDVYFHQSAEAAFELGLTGGFAVYCIEGEVLVGDQAIAKGDLISSLPYPLKVTGDKDSRFIILGGKALGYAHYLSWNFVSHDPSHVELAAIKWKEGGFDPVPGDSEFIPLPESFKL